MDRNAEAGHSINRELIANSLQQILRQIHLIQLGWDKNHPEKSRKGQDRLHKMFPEK